MITVILETENNEVVAECGKAGNERYLIRDDPDFPMLSLLSEIDYDVFASSDMCGLIDELKALRQRTNEEDQLHIDEVMGLAARCRDEDGLTLTFTPFG